MKKFLQNALLRSLCVLIFGVLLIVYSDEMTTWIVYACGGWFILLGGVAMVGYFRGKKSKELSLVYPAVAMGSALFGVVQLLFPVLFLGTWRYLLALMMLFLALIQMFSLFMIRKGGIRLVWYSFLLPLLGIGAALFVMLYKGFIENDPSVMIILGIAFVLYALLELWTVVLVRRNPVVCDRDEVMPVERIEK